MFVFSCIPMVQIFSGTVIDMFGIGVNILLWLKLISYFQKSAMLCQIAYSMCALAPHWNYYPCVFF